MPLAPIMIYGDDVTHLLTEEGIAYLYKARSLEERQAMIAAVAGVTSIACGTTRKDTERMRLEGLIALPEDLGIRRNDATRELLAARALPSWWSGRRPLQPACQIQELVMSALIARQAPSAAERLADLAVQALVDKADLSPKPGLVDDAAVACTAICTWG